MKQFLRELRRLLTAVPIRAGVIALALVASAALARSQALQPGGPVDFGSIALGASAQNLTLTFSANVVSTIKSVNTTTDGVQNKDFSLIANTCTGTLSPPASCYITIGFTPLQTGLRKGALSVIDGTGAVVNRLFLRGIGLAPQIALQPVAMTSLLSVSTLVPSTYQPSAVVVDGGGNLFFNDVANGRILEQASNGALSTYANVNTSSQSSMAISGAGTIYITQPFAGTVMQIPVGGQPVLLPTPGVTLGMPTGVTVDAIGYVYVSDAQNNTIVRIAPDGSSAFTFPLSGLGTPLSGPSGLAADETYLYVADTNNNRIVEVSLTTAAATAFPGTFPSTAPTGIVADPAGDILVTTAQGVYTISAAGMVNQIVLPGGNAITVTDGLALLPDGAIVVADPLAGLFTIVRNNASIVYPTPTTVGYFDSADGYATLTVQNTGNTILQLSGGDPAISLIDFTLNSGGNCPVAGGGSSAQIGVGVTCTYKIDFTPTAGGVRNGSVTLSGTAPGGGTTTTASAALQGTGVTDLIALQIVVSPAVTGLGQPVGFTLTCIATGGIVATDFLGTVQFGATDPKAAFLSGWSYTFTAADQGVHYFPAAGGIQFNTLGTFTVSAVNGNITGISNNVLVESVPTLTLSSSVNPSIINQQTTLTATIAGSNGQSAPTGTINFMDGATSLGTATITSGAATIPASFSSFSTHSLTAVYSGDTVYVGATSPAVAQIVEDFSIAVAASTSGAVTVNPGSTATFTFTVSPLGAGTFPGEIDLSVSGLPTGATAAFVPALMAAGSSTSNFTLNITNIKGQAIATPEKLSQRDAFPLQRLAPAAFALLVLPLALLRRRRLSSLLAVLLVCTAMFGLGGCLSAASAGYAGNGSGSGGGGGGGGGTGTTPSSPQTYNLVVSATSGQITRSAPVTLTVQ